MKERDIEQYKRFAAVVKATRYYQRMYFSTKDRDFLQKSKDGEKRVDQWIDGKALDSDHNIIQDAKQTTFLGEF